MTQTDYATALLDFETFSDEVARLAAVVREKKHVLEEIEAEIITNGGYGEIVIDGKNAETRSAQLALACRRSDRWLGTRAALDRAQNYLEDAQSNKELAAETMRYHRALLALETAQANERAYAHGGAK